MNKIMEMIGLPGGVVRVVSLSPEAPMNDITDERMNTNEAAGRLRARWGRTQQAECIAGLLITKATSGTYQGTIGTYEGQTSSVRGGGWHHCTENLWGREHKMGRWEKEFMQLI